MIIKLLLATGLSASLDQTSIGSPSTRRLSSSRLWTKLWTAPSFGQRSQMLMTAYVSMWNLFVLLHLCLYIYAVVCMDLRLLWRPLLWWQRLLLWCCSYHRNADRQAGLSVGGLVERSFRWKDEFALMRIKVIIFIQDLLMLCVQYTLNKLPKPVPVFRFLWNNMIVSYC